MVKRPPMPAREIAARRARILRAERIAETRGHSPADLAAAAGVHRSTWNRWRFGHGAPRTDQWDRIEALIGPVFPKRGLSIGGRAYLKKLALLLVRLSPLSRKPPRTTRA